MAENKRMANYELLRVVAMVMVVILHFLSHSDSLLALDAPISGVRILGTLLESFCLVAVNVYVFISGYFGVKGRFRPGKAVSLLCQIWFYGFLILAAALILGIPTQLQELGVYGGIQYLFPIESETYWFATSYFMLYLLSPVLNAAAQNMTRKQLKIGVAGLLILFSGIKSISPVVFPVDKYGYDLAWFICVYLLAAYLSLYGNEFFKKYGVLIYVGSSVVTFAMVMVLWFVSQKVDSFSYYFTVPFHYNFVLCLTGAIGLFYGFSKINIKEGRMSAFVRKLGVLSFGVYLFHEHIDIRDIWYGYLRELIHPVGGEGILFFLWELVCCIVILFAAGILIDYLRSLLFRWAGKVFAYTAVGKKLKALEREF